jgi:hypothetical protein
MQSSMNFSMGLLLLLPKILPKSSSKEEQPLSRFANMTLARTWAAQSLKTWNESNDIKGQHFRSVVMQQTPCPDDQTSGHASNSSTTD